MADSGSDCSNGADSAASSLSLDNVKAQPAAESAQEQVRRLERSLAEALQMLALKEARCQQLLRLQKSTDSELHTLTEQLFTEAYKLVDLEKAEKRVAEKRFTECQLKVEILEAEVDALKSSLKAKRPSLAQRWLSPSPAAAERPIRRSGSRSASSARPDAENTPPGCSAAQCAAEPARPTLQVDPLLEAAFLAWRDAGFPSDEQFEFLRRASDEDVRPCLRFHNEQLAHSVLNAIRTNQLEMERVRSGGTESTCALTAVQTICPYRMRADPNSAWCSISVLARNRIAAVCDFFTFVRYLAQGLVRRRTDAHVYWHLLGLRRNVLLAKLGLPAEPADALAQCVDEG